MDLKLDLIDQMTGKLTVNGYEFDRIAIVTGVTGDGHSKIYAAMNVAGMPAIGSSHPAVANCTLQSIDTLAVTPTQVKFRLSYATVQYNTHIFEDDSIRGGASVHQTNTNTKLNGTDFLVVEYTYPNPYDYNTGLSGKTVEYTAEVSVYRPQRTWSIQKRRAYNPEEEADAYVGKVNSSSWRDYDAKTWLCTAIEFYSDDGGSHYNVTYSFERSAWGEAEGKGSWEVEVSFKKDDGKEPNDHTPLSHYFEPEYNEIDFNNLSL